MIDPKYFLEKLLQLSHRGTCTPNSHKSAKIIEEEFKKLGLQPHLNEFNTIRNDKVMEVFLFSFFALSVILLFFGKIWWSIAFFGLGLFMQIDPVFPPGFRFSPRNIFRFFYRGRSENVYAEILPEDKQYKETIVLASHHDTSRWTIGLKFMGSIVKNTNIFTLNNKLPFFLRGPYLITNISICINIVIFFLPLHSIAQIIIGAYILLTYLLTLAMMFHTSIAPFNPGALDNASGVALTMSLASFFKDNKPKSTRIIFWSHGSEENKTKGFRELFKDANIDKQKTAFIVIDGIGANILQINNGESRGFGSVLYDKKLFEFIASTIKSKPEFYPIQTSFVPIGTDAGNLVDEKCRVMASIISRNEDSFYDHYHQMTDTIDKLNFKTINLCINFLQYLISSYDKSVS